MHSSSFWWWIKTCKFCNTLLMVFRDDIIWLNYSKSVLSYSSFNYLPYSYNLIFDSELTWLGDNTFKLQVWHFSSVLDFVSLLVSTFALIQILLRTLYRILRLVKKDQLFALEQKNFPSGVVIITIRSAFFRICP